MVNLGIHTKCVINLGNSKIRQPKQMNRLKTQRIDKTHHNLTFQHNIR